MWRLYYSKGSSALAAHILLEEAGLPYDSVEVSIAAGAHRRAAYLAINPKGRIPALATDAGVVTENLAILWSIADAAPEAGLWPEGAMARADALSLMSYLASTVHVAFAHKTRGARWADDPAAQAAMQAKVAPNLAEAARLTEDHLLRGPFALGARYSLCDPNLFLLSRWMEKAGVPIDAYPRLAAHRDLMLARPATRRAMALHGL